MIVLDQHTKTNPSDVDLTIRPEPGAWAGLLTSFADRRPAAAEAFRRELGLPTDRSVVMTGHQAQIWHPGILAKYLAADALAARVGAAAAWIVVDQDTNPPGVIRLPVRRGASGRRALRVETWPMDPAGEREHGDVPTGRQRPLRVGPAPTLDAGESWAAPGVAPGIEAIRAALVRHAEAPSAAAQVAGALADLLGPLVQRPGQTVLSLAIARTTLFAQIVEHVRRDPAACIREYNAAVAAHPHERIQPLGAEELPLWAIAPETGAKRRRVTIAQLASIPTGQLAPRALLMTGVLRWAACDLFIHGTGGGGGGGGGGHEGYDRITERWLTSWVGDEALLAPSVVATATLRLRIGHGGPAPTELRRAQWLAHRARHEPRLLDDAAADGRKRELVDQIRRIKRSGGDAKPLYRDMHALLGRTREAHAPRLRELQAAAEAAAVRVGDADIATDRTWAFPLYEADQVVALRERVVRAMG